MNPSEIQKAGDRAHQVVRRYHSVEIEGIKELALRVLPPPHHQTTPLIPSQQTESRFAIRLNRLLQHIPRVSRSADATKLARSQDNIDPIVGYFVTLAIGMAGSDGGYFLSFANSCQCAWIEEMNRHVVGG
jgi:hypothetical protein